MATINQYYPESVTHPGEILLESLEERGIGAKEFSVKTGKPEKTITAVLKGDSAITPDMSVLFEQVLKIPAHFWLEAQKNYDEFKARIKYQEAISNGIQWAKEAPYAEMAKLGWVPKTRKPEAKVINLFEYYEVASIDSFENYYFNQSTRVAFRISLGNTKNPLSVSAWLRQGEIQAKELYAPQYSKTSFKAILPEIKQLMASQPEDFFIKLQAMCLKVGVKVVHTPSLPNNAIHGATRWINDSPLIQLSGRWRRNDIFWFTFFHEVGHILLHGKKYISLENIDFEGENKEYEAEADAFASDWILTEKEEKEIIDSKELNKQVIVGFAEKFSTHPASIIGRLHHKGIIDYRYGREFFKAINFNL